MYVLKRKDRLYKAYSVWEPNKKGEMVSKPVIVEFLGYLSEILKQDPDGLEKLREKIRSESKAAYLEERASDAKALMDEVNQYNKERKSGENKKNFKGHPALNYANYILWQIWKELGLNRVLDYHWSQRKAEFNAPALLWQTVANRIVSPCSHRRHYAERMNWLGAPLEEASQWDLYRMLDFAYLQKDRILKTANRHIKEMGFGDMSIVFYDVTNTWYETPHTDEQKLEMRIAAELASLGADATQEDKEKAVEKVLERTTSTLRMHGMSKEGRRDPLISIALVVNRDGIPIDFYVYSGNSSEKTTMEDSIAALEKKYNIKNCVVVADGGLNTKPNIMRLAKRKHGFLLARSLAKMKETLRKEILSNDGWQWNEEGTLKLKEIETEETMKVDGEKKTVKCRIIAGWSEKRKNEDLFRIATHKKAALEAIKEKKDMKGANWGWKKYVVSAESKASKLNLENIAKDEEIAGYFAYEFKDGRDYDESWSENPTDTVSAREVMEQYHNLSKIEECFRIMKTNFDLRPLFVYTDVHVVAQVLICVLALMVIRILAKKLEIAGHPMTIDEIIFALSNSALVGAFARPGSRVMFAPLRMELLKLEPGADSSIELELYGESNLSRIMETVGLRTLPEYCDKDELARCLGTRFDTNRDAVGYLPKNTLRKS